LSYQACQTRGFTPGYDMASGFKCAASADETAQVVSQTFQPPQRNPQYNRSTRAPLRA